MKIKHSISGLVSTLALFLGLSASTPVAIAADLTLSTWTTDPLTKKDRTGYLDLILIEAFKRINLTISLTIRPAERSLVGANSGVVDGEYIRIAGIEEVYPNLIRVPVKIMDMEFVVFTKKKNINIDGWKSLKPYNVGIERGWKILEKNVKYTKSRHLMKSAESMFKMVALDRLDIALYSRHLGRKILGRLKIPEIRDLAPPLAVREMFLYLNKKHAKLIPKLTLELNKMKQDGTFKRVFKQALIQN